MKNFIITLVVCLVALAGIIYVVQNTKDLKDSLNIAINNEKAALAEADSLKNQSIAYQYTIEQLNSSNDSIVAKLNAARKEIKVKDKKIKELSYLASEATKTDTLRLRDTIFREVGFKLDTTIGDSWYKCNIGLEYPNKITVAPSFKSEKSIIVSSKRETVFPEKRCWLARLFQRKHTVLEVNVVENSPYIETTESKFIQIID